MRRPLRPLDDRVAPRFQPHGNRLPAPASAIGLLMVPDAYRSFFSECASVAGALIGLLFVAISVAPHKLAGERAEVAFQTGAGAAFAALLNTLVIALASLLPGTNLPLTSLVLGAIGTGTVVGLTVISVRAGDVRRHWTGLIRLGILLAVFVLQLVNALRWLTRQDSAESIHTEAVLCIVLFVIAINQAWKLLDAQGARLLPLLVQLVRRHHPAAPTARSKQPTRTGH
jgi:hypothetical protein